MKSERGDTEKYLVLEIQPFLSRLSVVERDSTGKQVIVNDCRQFSSLDELKRQLADNPTVKSANKIIIGFGNDKAATDFLYCKLQRNYPDQPISEPELDGLVTQLVRNNLPADQLYIRGVIIDGRRMANPVGLTGGEISFYFSRSQINREVLAELMKLLPTDRISLMGAAGSFWTHVLSRILPAEKSFILTVPSYDTTAFFVCRRGFISCRQQFRWGEKNLLSVLFGRLAVNQPMAREILKIYCQRELSLSFFNKLSGFFAGEFNDFSRHLRLILTEEKINSVYFLPLFDFPWRQLKLGLGIKSSPVDNYFIVQKLGFELKLKEGLEATADELFAIPLFLAELDTITLDNVMNKTAGRRLRWHKNGI